MAKVKILDTISSWWQKVDEAPSDPKQLLKWFNQLRSVTGKFRAELKRRETSLEKEGFKKFNPDWTHTSFTRAQKVSKIKSPSVEQVESAQKEATELMTKLRSTPTLREWKKIKKQIHQERIENALREAGVSETEWGDFYRIYKAYHNFARFSQGSDDALQLEKKLLRDPEWQEKLVEQGLEEVIQEWLGLRSTPHPGNPEDVF